MPKRIPYEIYLKYYKLYKDETIQEDESMPRKKVKTWEGNLRTIYNNGSMQEDGSIILETKSCRRILSKKDIDILNEANFDWQINKYWNQNFKILERYIKKKKPYKDSPIQNFVEEMRKIHNKGKLQEDGSIEYLTKKGKRILKKEQIDKLNSINFIWNEHDQAWLDNYHEFIDFVNKNNKYPTETDNKTLNRWVTRQKQTFLKGERRKDGSIKFESTVLKPWQIDMLNEINFAWVEYENAYYRRLLKTKGSVQGAERYLLLKLRKYCKENNKETTIYNVEDELKLMLK